MNERLTFRLQQDDPPRVVHPVDSLGNPRPPVELPRPAERQFPRFMSHVRCQKGHGPFGGDKWIVVDAVGVARCETCTIAAVGAGDAVLENLEDAKAFLALRSDGAVPDSHGRWRLLSELVDAARRPGVELAQRFVREMEALALHPDLHERACIALATIFGEDQS